VKEFWALWDNIYDTVCLLLQIFPSFLTLNLLLSLQEYKNVKQFIYKSLTLLRFIVSELTGSYEVPVVPSKGKEKTVCLH
jgi:hypothetical protein